MKRFARFVDALAWLVVENPSAVILGLVAVTCVAVYMLSW